MGSLTALFAILAVAFITIHFGFNVYNRLKKDEQVPIQKRNVEKNDFFDYLIEQDLAQIEPKFGQWGQPSYIEEIKDGDQNVANIRRRYGMNVNVSDRISYKRKLPDTRPLTCPHKTYDTILPKASIIIVSHDEAWSILIRSLHSIVDRTPTEHIKEVILVDDGSLYPELAYSFHEKLEYYINMHLPIITMIKLNESVGIVNARLTGAKAASGDVLIFMEPHIEVNVGWIQPILHKIKSRPTAVVQPVLDAIHWDTFEYSPLGSISHLPAGIFTWYGTYEWVDEYEIQIEGRTRRSITNPLKNPVMAEGVYAIDKRYFWDIGAYDPEMKGWGAENIEMSIRIWSCGGTIEISPCSRVGHVFLAHSSAHPSRNRYEIQQNYAFNLLRTVKVWWDDYDRILFQYRPFLKNKTFGDITERQTLRKNLGCQPFSWYLSKVLTKFVMDREVEFSGQLKSDTGLCITFRGKYESGHHESAYLLPCDETLTGRQYFAYSKSFEIRRELLCLVPKNDMNREISNEVSFTWCEHSRLTRWVYDRKTRQFNAEGYKICLDSENAEKATYGDCDPEKPTQRWSFINQPMTVPV